MFRKILTVALAGGAIAATFGTTVAQADDKALCKNGGYVGYVDPATGQPFANQSQCVSFVAKGGTIVPVKEEVAIDYSIILAPYDYGDSCTAQVVGTGEPDSVHVVQVHSDEPGATVFPPEAITVGAEGSFVSREYAFRISYPFTVTVDGEVNQVNCPYVR